MLVLHSSVYYLTVTMRLQPDMPSTSLLAMVPFEPDVTEASPERLQHEGVQHAVQQSTQVTFCFLGLLVLNTLLLTEQLVLTADKGVRIQRAWSDCNSC